MEKGGTIRLSESVTLPVEPHKVLHRSHSAITLRLAISDNALDVYCVPEQLDFGTGGSSRTACSAETVSASSRVICQISSYTSNHHHPTPSANVDTIVCGSAFAPSREG